MENTVLGSDYGEIFEAQPPDTLLQYVIDAGTFMNSPYPLVLRPQRAVDILLSFDFSGRKQERQDLFYVSIEFLHTQVIVLLLITDKNFIQAYSHFRN